MPKTLRIIIPRKQWDKMLQCPADNPKILLPLSAGWVRCLCRIPGKDSEGKPTNLRIPKQAIGMLINNGKISGETVMRNTVIESYDRIAISSGYAVGQPMLSAGITSIRILSPRGPKDGWKFEIRFKDIQFAKIQSVRKSES